MYFSNLDLSGGTMLVVAKPVAGILHALDTLLLQLLPALECDPENVANALLRPSPPSSPGPPYYSTHSATWPPPSPPCSNINP
jgi:hypothetical protein